MSYIQQYLDNAKRNMEEAYRHIQTACARVNAGRALPTMLNGSWETTLILL